MKVAIIFIGTGKYINFLPKFYENVEKYFLPNSQKTFLVFTDGKLEESPENIIPYYQKHLEWPYITLTRFEIINRARDEISKNDLLVFLDADTLVVDEVLEEDFISDKPLFGVWHPCHNMGMPPHNKLPGSFETNPLSLAYVNVEEEKPSVYYQGCLWGGKVPKVLDMIDELQDRVDKDLKKNVIAVWHDESHINKYFIEHQDEVSTLNPEYAYPEVFADQCNFEPKIVHLAKDNSKYHT